MRPDAQEHVLRHVFGFDLTAEHAAAQIQDARQVARQERARGRVIAGGDAHHKLAVWIHRHACPSRSEVQAIVLGA